MSTAEENQATELGKEAPDFSLPSLSGETISLSDFRGRSRTVLVFLRGFT